MGLPLVKKHPLVSVCIPSYNASKYIGKTIGSVLDSTYSNLEIIVNDDASTDDTKKIVEDVSDERVRFFQNESNLGPPTNWNRCLEKASGRFVGLLNHDDLYDPFFLIFAVNTLQKNPHIGWVASAFRVVDDKGQTLDVVSRFADTREYSLSEAFRCIAKLDGLAPGFIVRQEILEEVGYYDEDAGFSADNDLFLRLASKCILYYSSYPHTACRLHADNLTHRWGIVEQTTEGFRTLNKVFGDDVLPQELRKNKRFCYNHFYHKVLTRAKRLAKKGDLETVQRLDRLLYTNGYRDDKTQEPYGYVDGETDAG